LPRRWEVRRSDRCLILAARRISILRAFLFGAAGYAVPVAARPLCRRRLLQQALFQAAFPV